MTIGIAAWGPNAGLAVFNALQSAESAGSGSIGGYAAFVAITTGGAVLRAETQRGGTLTLFVSGETTGTEPPAEIVHAPLAAVMSSGPDRPEPLAQFLPADGSRGLVTGHRLPNQLSVAGRPLNAEVLALMREGISARHALERVLQDNPESDSGMIAASVDGDIASRNSARVGRRSDLGSARRTWMDRDGKLRAVIEVIHNAIFPSASLAPLVADVGLESMAGATRSDGHVLLRAGTQIVPGNEDSVDADENGQITRVVTTDHRLVTGQWNCAAVYLGSVVRFNEVIIGRTLLEPNVVVADGRIVSMSGKVELKIGYRRHDSERCSQTTPQPGAQK